MTTTTGSSSKSASTTTGSGGSATTSTTSSASVDAGGTANTSSGGSGAGGSAGSGGVSTSQGGGGGSSGSGGGGAGGGAGSTGEIGTPGDACASPGSLACSGNHQKLTLVCGGSGEWEVNETCEAAEFCDSSDGDTTGLCLEPEADCVDRAVDEAFCLNGDLYTCQPDGITPALSEDCAVRCVDGACIDESDPCPTEGIFVNCDPACGETDCLNREGELDLSYGETGVFRTGAYDDALDWNCENGERFFTLQFPIPVPDQIRITVAPPWKVMFGLDTLDACDFSTADICAFEPSSPQYAVFVTNDPEAPPTNALVEFVTSDAHDCDNP